MKFILGKKIDMTQVWHGDVVIGVTRVQAGPCTIVQVRNKKNDGYEAVQLGYGTRKEKNVKKPQIGHMKELGIFRYLREFRLDNEKVSKKNQVELEVKRGDKIDVGTFDAGDKVKVISTSKGKGFQGVVKRHGFHGQDKTHGNKDQLRMPGSIGSTGPQHVFKGVRMPGRMGGERVTTTNLEIVEIDKENNIILIKGSVPGANNGLVMIVGEGELKIQAIDNKKDEIENPENIDFEKTEKADEAVEGAKAEVKAEEVTEAPVDKENKIIEDDKEPVQEAEKIEENK